MKDEGYDLILYVCGSEEVHKKMAEERGYKYFSYTNNPLSRKFQHLMVEAMKDDWDYWLLMGSDDLFVEGAGKIIASQMNSGHDAGQCKEIMFWHYHKKRGFYIKDSVRLGAGRWYKREVLDQMPSREIYNSNQDKGLDGVSERAILKYTGVTPHHFEDEAYICDVKTSENIWTFDKVRKHMDRESGYFRRVDSIPELNY